MSVKEKTSNSIIISLMVWIMAWSVPVWADEACLSDAFLIDNHHAEASAATGNLARTQATDTALNTAWQMLINRLVIDWCTNYNGYLVDIQNCIGSFIT